MPQDRVCKTIRQYSKGAIPNEDMEKLQEIADDYAKVKQYVYARYGGIGGLAKIYPGYTVQNEMTASGFRQELGMPSVYFYLAVFEALGDIRGRWEQTKAKVRQLAGRNENLTEEDRHYLRFLLKVNNAFEAVLNRKAMELPEGVRRQYEKLAGQVETERLNNYLCRQVRKVHMSCGVHADCTLHTGCCIVHTGYAQGEGRKEDGRQGANGFSIAERAYRYGRKDGQQGIFISIKEQRRRIFIPLTDNNQYGAQLYIRLYPEEQRVEINVPVYMQVRRHADYRNQVGISLGMYTMLTTDQGHRYGDELGKYQLEYADWIRKQARSYLHNRDNNPGRKKYYAKKKRLEEQLHGYINQELSRFLREEKPQRVYIVKYPKPQGGGLNRKINHSVNLWQRGYIRSRLELKCREREVELAEVLGKDISRECSKCGAMGNRKDGQFHCEACGQSMDEKWNTAGNVLKRGLEGKILH